MSLSTNDKSIWDILLIAAQKDDITVQLGWIWLCFCMGSANWRVSILAKAMAIKGPEQGGGGVREWTQQRSRCYWGDWSCPPLNDVDKCFMQQILTILQFTHCNFPSVVDWIFHKCTRIGSSYCCWFATPFTHLHADPSTSKFCSSFCCILLTHNIFAINFHVLVMNCCYCHSSCIQKTKSQHRLHSWTAVPIE